MSAPVVNSITFDTFLVGKPDPTNVTGSDTGGRHWDKISDDGKTAKFTGLA